MSTDVRLVAYTPNTSTIAGVLEGFREFNGNASNSTPTALRWEQPLSTPGAEIVDTAVEVQMQVRKNGGSWVDLGGRHDLVVTSGDRLAKEQVRSCEAVSMWDRLAHAMVYGPVPIRDLGEPAQVQPRVFTDKNAYQIMSTLILEEKDRGRLAGISINSSGSLPVVPFFELGHGSSLDVALQALCDRGACQANWNGRTLMLTPINTGRDLTTGMTPVLLTVGRDLLDAPKIVSREGQVNTAMVRGDNGVTVEVMSGAAGPFGNAAISLDAPGIQDTASLEAIGLAELNRLNRERIEWKVGINLNPDRTDHFAPGVDYVPGDRVLVRLSGTETVAATVRQIVISTNKNGVASAAVVLGDKMEDYDSRLARQQRMATSGIVPAPGGVGTGDEGIPPVPEWNPEWGEMPAVAETHCAPSCDCRQPRYPDLVGRNDIVVAGSYIPAWSSSDDPGANPVNPGTSYWMYAYVDFPAVNGHKYRISWDSLPFRWDHTHNATYELGGVPYREIDVVLYQGYIAAGEEHISDWLQNHMPGSTASQIRYSTLRWHHDTENLAVKTFEAGQATVEGTWDGTGQPGSAHWVRVVLTMRHTMYALDNRVNLYGLTSGMVTVEDLG